MSATPGGEAGNDTSLSPAVSADGRTVAFDSTATDLTGDPDTNGDKDVFAAVLNSAPVAIDDSATTAQDTAVTVDVLANDSDPDGDALTVAAVTDPANGGVVTNADDTVTYTPAAGFVGSDAFDYTVADGLGGTATATVTVEVTPAPPGPPGPPEPPEPPEPPSEVPVVRVSGPDRVATAVAASQEGFGSGEAGAVVLARADAFADALAGTPLAIAVDAPILLTPSGVLDERVASEIQRVLPAGDTVHVLGGEEAIQAQTVAAAEDLAITPSAPSARPASRPRWRSRSRSANPTRAW